MKLLWLVLLVELVTELVTEQKGLFPAILNLASNAVISSNATCGDPEPEIYCKLVEHVPGKRIKNPHCPRCDANSVLLKEQHPITNAIDGTNQWWQSPSIKNGRQFHWITITLDLKQIFQVAYIIIKAANSPRPGNWILERSVDGLTFDPWQFYAISDSECLTRYNIPPRIGPPTYRKDTEVICTSYYSRLNPLEHGEIHTSLINGRPGADDLTSDLLHFTSARYIRLRLQRIRTLNADLMTLSTREPRDIDPIVTRRYYYSIKDISVGGMCICYGHAQSCPLDPVTKKFQCLCEHNTCGESCNECCPGYHQLPWRPGTVSQGNNCERCNCHNKALDCFYNQTVSDLALSLNSHGVRQGGGVCINCQQNTAGINCETCSDGYYRPAEVSPHSDSPCVECHCDMRGSKSPVCLRDDLQPGQCLCLQGFTGRRCDRCAFGFQNFPQCIQCDCNLSGSTNTDPCLPCTCKVNVMGSHCDLCKPGFYNLQHKNPQGCTDCFCFGVSDVCESSTWSTRQVNHANAWLHPSQSLQHDAVVHGNHLPETGNTSFGHVLQWAAPKGFLGNKLVSYGGFLNFSVLYDILADSEDQSLPVTCDINIKGYSQTLRLSTVLLHSLTALAEEKISVQLLPQQFVDSGTGLPVTREELLLVLSGVLSLKVRVHTNTSADGPVRLNSVSLDVAESNLDSTSHPLVAVETCECPWGYSGTSCETCDPGFYRVGGVLFGGNCLQCDCNGHSTECDANGVCLNCLHNTTGSHCERCLPGFYGDAGMGTAVDCRVCACPLTDSSNRFSPTCLLDTMGNMSCDQCQEGYAGATCERCASGYYGNPQVVGGACFRCQCNGNVDTEDPEHCDTVTGDCLRCHENTTGTHCELCQPGYYGDAVNAKNCRECNCDAKGAVSSQCHVTTGQCVCRDHVTGQTCDQCQVGFFRLSSGQGCVACNCSQSGSMSRSCDEKGRCQCVEGVAGDKCNYCRRGYYGFGDNGCRACICPHTSSNCDPENGQCVCPAHTEGQTCERCEPSYWGHDFITGCKPCGCTTVGSSSSQCDRTNGQCRCRTGFTGMSCDQCAPGYYGYPECTECGCDVAGTDKAFCNLTHGVCDCRHTGECVCKVGVSGRHCEECAGGLFGLSVENPRGCSRCFCSGVSSDCEEQGGLTLLPVGLHPAAVLSLVHQSDLQPVMSGVYQQGDEIVLDTRQLHSNNLSIPLYWRLPEQFQGRKLLSYGGLLSYVVTFYAEDGSGPSNQEPQVLLRGGTLRKLLIYTDMTPPPNGVATQHNIRLTEHRWRYFNSVLESSVSRDDFMFVLSDVKYVMIKASYGSRLMQSRIANITMETAVEVAQGSELQGGGVILIESCDCPLGYSGLSCEDCAVGYFHQPQSELSSRSQKSMFVRPCVPCRCNNHSQTCNAQSGECQDCQHQTSGQSCELCSPGYHGNVNGSINDCLPCACPLHNNSFSPTCVSDGSPGDFRCTSCQIGYEGRYCERCGAGYYGNPLVVGGACAPCNCSEFGSIHSQCDHLTGQCECRPMVIGQLCDQCENRHVKQGPECVSCDDRCSGVLLDDMGRLDGILHSVNISAISTAPFWLLLQLENRSSELQVLFTDSSVALLPGLEDDLTQVKSGLNDLLTQLTHLTGNLEAISLSTSGSFSRSSLLLENIKTLEQNIDELQQKAGQLDPNTAPVLDSVNQTHLLQEAQLLVENIRSVNQTAAENAASQELSLSVSLFHALHLDFLSKSLLNGLSPLSTNLTVTMEMLQLANTQLREASHKNNETHTVVETTQALLQQYQSVLQIQAAGCRSTEKNIEESRLSLGSAVFLTEDLISSSSVEVLSGQLKQWRPLLRKQVDTLVVGLKMTGALEKVYTAESHADLLQNHSYHMQSSVSSVRNVSGNAVQLAEIRKYITERVDSAHQAASGAFQSAAAPLTMTSQLGNPMSHSCEAKQNISVKILKESQELRKTSEELQRNVSIVTSTLGLVREQVANVTVLLIKPVKELQYLSNGVSQLQQPQLQAATARSGLETTLQQLQSLAEQLQDSQEVLAGATEGITQTNTLMSQTQAAANEAQHKLELAEVRTQHLMDRMKPLNILGDRLGRNLSDIRDLINQARRQAASIKVAVAADRKCVRTYKPNVESTNFNQLSLTVKTRTRDNLLFYLGSNTMVDFLAVEVHDGKVSLRWNLGSGGAKLDFNNINITNNRWTQINGTRFGASSSLSVHQLDSDTTPLPAVTGMSPGSSRVLDVDANTVVHIGGLPAGTQGSGLHSPPFVGCLSDVTLNHKNIGLWNYEQQNGDCGACFSSPQAEETSFYFDGSGFSLVHKSLRSTSTSVVFLFKTRSPAGLLLFLSSNNTKDFLSIELVKGRVQLTFDLGSGALVLTSRKFYNNGYWFKVTLQRNKRKGYLSIMAADQSSEKEILEAESPGTASDLNRSDLDPIYIGGLPASRPIRRQPASWSYVGCIKNVEIARSNFNLLRDAYGVRKGCVLQVVESVSVLSAGFLQIVSQSFSQEVQILFTFSSKIQSGILLAALSETQAQRKHFLSVHLMSGALGMELGEVSGSYRSLTVMKTDGGSFSDGVKHSVILTVNRKSMSLQVDEQPEKSASVFLGGLSHLSPASVFIGGLPTDVSIHLPNTLKNLSATFRGCIQRVVIGGELVDLSRAVMYDGVEFDSCLEEGTTKGVVRPEDQNLDPTPAPSHLPVGPPTHLSALTPGVLTCASEIEPEFLPSAAYFGLARHSHMIFTIEPSAIKKSVSLRLSVRSWAETGLLALLADSRQTDFVAVALRGGRVVMSADLGKGPASVSSPVLVNDGRWHTLTAELNRRTAALTVDDSSPDVVSVRGNQLNVDGRLYLGGAATSASRRINVSTSLPGCIRSVSLNDAVLNLLAPTSRHDVAPCFTTDQTGSFFDGSGFIELIHQGYKVGSDLAVSLEFRTSQSEAVLVGISSAKVDAIGLEMSDGQMIFNVNNGAGRVTVRSTGHMLCDGLWHHLLARKTKHTLSLTVDGRSFSTRNPYPQSTSAETNNPVYVGGYPGGVKQNCLSVGTKFRGCLKNLQLFKSHMHQVLDLRSAHFSSGVTPLSCPTA